MRSIHSLLCMIAVRTLHKKCRVCVSQELQQQQLNRRRNGGSLNVQLGSVTDFKNVF